LFGQSTSMPPPQAYPSSNQTQRAGWELETFCGFSKGRMTGLC
jgi:hypothetical protein